MPPVPPCRSESGPPALDPSPSLRPSPSGPPSLSRAGVQSWAAIPLDFRNLMGGESPQMQTKPFEEGILAAGGGRRPEKARETSSLEGFGESHYNVGPMGAEQHVDQAGGPIQVNPSILSGKPFLRGTRLGVDFLQGLLATGWTRESIQEVYPYVPPADLDAALSHKP